MMKVYIDCREHQLVQLFIENEIDIIKKQLDIGDILITNEEDVVLCIIERKTVQDLLASIKDGRYKEQHSRLTANFNLKHILYVIEEYKSFSSLDNKSVESSIIHTLFRDDTKFLFTRNINDTFYLIQALLLRIENHPEYFQTSGFEKKEESVFVKTMKKSSNDSKDSVNHQLLCQIPGISSQSAQAIRHKFGSICCMITQLHEMSEEEKKKELSGIKVNGRKLNKTIVENILKYVFV
jgi:ERCC4-type nuclease